LIEQFSNSTGEQLYHYNNFHKQMFTSKMKPDKEF